MGYFYRVRTDQGGVVRFKSKKKALKTFKRWKESSRKKGYWNSGNKITFERGGFPCRG